MLFLQVGLKSLAVGMRDRPVLFHVKSKSAHGTSSTIKATELTAQIYSFVFYNLESRPNSKGR